MLKRSSGLILLTLFFFFSSAELFAAQVRVLYKKNGRDEVAEGVLKTDSMDKVIVDKTEISPRDIGGVEDMEFIADIPQDFQSAMSDFNRGNFDEAHKLFSKAVKGMKPGNPESVYAQYFMGRCQQALGKFSSAVSDYEESLKDAKSRIRPYCLYQLIQCRLSENKVADAEAKLKDFESLYEGNKSNLPEIWELKAAILKGDVMFKGEKFKEAQTAYEAASKNTLVDKSSKEYGELMFKLGNSVLSGGDDASAEKAFKMAMESETNAVLQAGGYLGMGKLLLKKNKADEDAKALSFFLVVMYGYTGVDDLQDEARLGAAECYSRIAKSGGDKYISDKIKTCLDSVSPRGQVKYKAEIEKLRR